MIFWVFLDQDVFVLVKIYINWPFHSCSCTRTCYSCQSSIKRTCYFTPNESKVIWMKVLVFHQWSAKSSWDRDRNVVTSQSLLLRRTRCYCGYFIGYFTQRPGMNVYLNEASPSMVCCSMLRHTEACSDIYNVMQWMVYGKTQISWFLVTCFFFFFFYVFVFVFVCI